MIKMKKIAYYKIAAFTLAFSFILQGCDSLEDFGTTNVNPGATNNPITSALLTNVLSAIGSYAAINGPALYCQYFSETQYPELSLYVANLSTPSTVYATYLYDLQNIINTNTDEATKATAALNGANENQIAIARILKAYLYWNLTDRWGDIPYSDALKGNPNVTYDTQESIYKDMIKELTEAVAQFTTGAPIKGDIVYNGDISKWKKFANSMRMLMALRLSKVYSGASDYAATQFKAALNDPAGSISNNADNFTIKYLNTGSNPVELSFKNPNYNRYDGRKDYGESQTMTDMLNSLSDGRQSAFGAAANGSPSSKGVPFGRVRTYIDPWCQQNTDYCYVLAPAHRQETSPLHVIHAAAVLLARAEAADKGWTTENTLNMYKAGVSASFQQWGLSAPPDEYFNNANAALGAAGTNLKPIAIQQWIAWYPDGCQGWANWRRTNFPTLLPAPDASNSPKVIPRRYCYGTADYNLTKTGVEAAVARLTGGDKMDSKVWWDK
jgi:hypothetical protein